MSIDPWTSPEPQPGDFDGEVAMADERYVEYHDGHPRRS